MSPGASTFLGWLLECWRALAPGPDTIEPVVTVVDPWRTDFAWRGRPLTIDRRRQVVLRGGHELLRIADIQSVDVTHVRADEDSPELWKVGFSTGLFMGAEIGRTRDDVDASIAAARLSTVVGVKVRSL